MINQYAFAVSGLRNDLPLNSWRVPSNEALDRHLLIRQGWGQPPVKLFFFWDRL